MIEYQPKGWNRTFTFTTDDVETVRVALLLAEENQHQAVNLVRKERKDLEINKIRAILAYLERSFLSSPPLL